MKNAELIPSGVQPYLCISLDKSRLRWQRRRRQEKMGSKKLFASPTAERRWRKNENVYQQYGQEQCRAKQKALNESVISSTSSQAGIGRWMCMRNKLSQSWRITLDFSYSSLVTTAWSACFRRTYIKNKLSRLVKSFLVRVGHYCDRK